LEQNIYWNFKIIKKNGQQWKQTEISFAKNVYFLLKENQSQTSFSLYLLILFYEKVMMDITSSKEGFRLILTIVDVYSRILLIPLKQTNFETIISATIFYWISTHFNSSHNQISLYY